MENGKKVSMNSATLMNKILELVEAQNYLILKSEKLDILIHPSLVHAIVQLNNGITKFIYHETSMIVRWLMQYLMEILILVSF